MEQLSVNPGDLPTWTHIISIVIGGVVFKYFDKWLSFKKESADQEIDESKMIIESLMRQVETLGQRISTLETERTALHERELVMVKALSTAEMKATLLEEKVDFLQKNQDRLILVVTEYEKKFGKISP